MENLTFIKEWDLLLQKIAEVLNVSIDAVQQNADVYLAEFGRYQLIQKSIGGIPFSIFIGFLLFALSMPFIGLAYRCCDLEDLVDTFKENKKILKVPMILLFSPVVYWIVYEIILYLSSPKIYAIKELFYLLK